MVSSWNAVGVTLAVSALLVGCGKDDTGVAADPEALLVSADLVWNVGDRRVTFYDDAYDEAPAAIDTIVVTDVQVRDGVRTVSWSDGFMEAVVDGQYRVQRYPLGWQIGGVLPAARGDVIDRDTLQRTGEDGTPLGEVETSWICQSPDTTIVVPAGTFRCAAFRQVVSDVATGMVMDDPVHIRWYAPGYGTVQLLRSRMSPDGVVSDVTMQYHLQAILR